MDRNRQELLERELGRRGMFESVSPSTDGRACYVTRRSASVMVELQNDFRGLPMLTVTCRFTAPMNETMSQRIISDANIERVAKAYGGFVSASADGLPTLSTGVTCPPVPEKFSDGLRRLFIRFRMAVLSVQAEMRRMKMAEFVAPLSSDEFWAETIEETEYRMLETSTDVKTVTLGGLRINYTDELAGGGQVTGNEIVDFIERQIGQVDRAYEWCSGPGFLGYALLGKGLCRSLCLADINPKAVEICRRTARENALLHGVVIYESDCLDSIPESEQWDLVVGNPPWLTDKTVLPEWGCTIKYRDVNLDLHRRFFNGIGRHLRPGAHLVIAETYLATSIRDFQPMLEEGGFRLRGVYEHSTTPYVYYMWLEAAECDVGYQSLKHAVSRQSGSRNRTASEP